MLAIGDDIRDVLLVSELRTIAADELWMSPQYRRASLGLHFTWKREPEAASRAVDAVEAALAPFDPRPHWGKVFHTPATLRARARLRRADGEAGPARGVR